MRQAYTRRETRRDELIRDKRRDETTDETRDLKMRFFKGLETHGRRINGFR